VSLNRVRLSYQKLGSVQLVHLDQVASCAVEILLDRTARPFLEQPENSIEKLLNALIEVLAIRWLAPRRAEMSDFMVWLFGL
jgi:hypothetical protein